MDTSTLHSVENKIHFIRVAGSWSRMGEEFGKICASISRETLQLPRFCRDLIKNMIKGSNTPAYIRHTAPLLSSLLYSSFSFLNRSNGSLRQFQEGFATGAGIPSRTAVQLIHFADIMHCLTGYSGRVPSGACSAFFVRNEMTEHGGALLGRNFDFFGPERWDRWQAIKVFHPDHGEPFFWIGPLGLPVGGFGGNRHGITVMPFTNFCAQTSWRGEPVFQIMQRILSECTSIEEARGLIDRVRVHGGISLLITDMKNSKATAVGMTCFEKEMIIPEENRLIRTNHFATRPLQASESIPSRWRRNSHSRYQRLQQLVSGLAPLNSQKAASILSDRFDQYTNDTVFGGDIVSAINNATSVIVDWNSDALYLANGEFPMASTSDYAGFRYSSLFETPKALPGINNPNKFDPAEKKAMEYYLSGWTSIFENHDIVSAGTAFSAGVAALPHSPLLLLFNAVTEMQSGNFDTARSSLSKLLEQPRRHHWHWEAVLWNARLLDLLGHRDEAVSWYTLLQENGGEKLALLGGQGIKKAYKQKQLKNIRIDCITGTTI